MTAKKIIPIFYAADENYLPYMAVSVCSLKEKASKAYKYQIYVLHAGMNEESENAKKLCKYEDEDFRFTFVDVSKQMQEVKNSLQLRDYYTCATYYRIFIANMFPQYEKAVYLDSDTVLLGDVSELYNVELGENLLGAVPDGAVASVEPFKRYTKEVLGIESKNYFNAGVLVMNLQAFRDSHFYENFCALLKVYKFSVAQDQDYLNVLCKNRVAFLGAEWNTMPIEGYGKQPKLIHYNLTMKPWHYENVLYKEYFWQYAQKTEFFSHIVGALHAYSQTKKDADAASEKALIALCIKEAEREDNYWKKFGKY